jgi:Tfp pilus assembly protein PilF
MVVVRLKVRKFMDRSSKNLILSEWYNAHHYLSRLYHALLHHPHGPLSPSVRELLRERYYTLHEHFQDQLLDKTWAQKPLAIDSIVELQQKTHALHDLVKSFLSWREIDSELIEFSVEAINHFYDLAYELHWYLNEVSDLEIQYPRLGLLQMNPLGLESTVVNLAEHRQAQAPKNFFQPQEVEETDNDNDSDRPEPKRFGAQGLYAIDGDLEKHTPSSLPALPDLDESLTNEDLNWVAHFFLSIDDVQQACENGLDQLEVVEQQRFKRYEDMVKEGHEAVFNKDHNRALECFTKAFNYRDTSEVLTLLGWAHSLLGQLDKAKSYCLKAIQKDPDYGPPYNDLGSYLLAEGQIEESLKWFDLAKRSLNYQNREYPYINSGRAYMTKKDLNRALDEFSKALTLAPFHEDLHKTVEKLKKSLLKMNDPKENKESRDLETPFL